MTNGNGKTASAEDILRETLRQTQRALGNEHQECLKAVATATMVSHILATLLHREGLDGTKVTADEKNACLAYCAQRVRVKMVEEDDGEVVVQLCLEEITDEERAKAKKQMKANKRKLKLLDPHGGMLE